MRITAELVSICEQRTNPLGEREIILNGYGIPLIENLGSTVGGSNNNNNDAFDTYNFCNNRITKIENFPKLLRVTNLLFDNNLIDSIDSTNVSKNIPNIQYLTLSYNHITTLSVIYDIGKAFTKLQYLSLVGNPVTRKQYYRLYTIHTIPSLKVLDYNKVKPSERNTAQRLFRSAAGAALERDIQLERDYGTTTTGSNNTTSAKTFVPGEGLPEEHFVDTSTNGTSSSTTTSTIFTDEQKEQIRQLLVNATSVQEVEEIETAVRKGILPQQLVVVIQQQQQHATNEPLDVSPSVNDTNNDEPDPKRLRVS